MGLPESLLKLAGIPAVLICLYAFAIPLGTSPPYFVVPALVVPALLTFAACAEVRENRVLQYALAWAAVVLLLAVRADLAGLPGNHVTRTESYFFLSLAPFVAVQIAIAARAVPFHTLALASLACFLAAGALRLFWWADWSAPLHLFAHYYDGGGGAKRGYLSIVAGLVILAALSLAIHQLLGAGRLTVRALRAFPLLAIGGLAGVALVAMVNRTGMIATGVALAVWAIAFAGMLRSQGRRRKITLAAILAGALAVALTVLALGYSGLLGQRMTNPESLGQRLLLFRLAAELIAQRPLLGWGTDVGQLLLERADLDFIRAENSAYFTHFHNVYLEFTLGVGVLGFGLFLLFVGALAYDVLTRRSSLSVALPTRAILIAFAIAAILFLAIAGMAESINRVRFATQSLTLIAGFLLASGSIGASIDRLFAAERGQEKSTP